MVRERGFEPLHPKALDPKVSNEYERVRCVFRAIANSIPIDREQCSDSFRTAFRMIANSIPEHPEQKNPNY